MIEHNQRNFECILKPKESKCFEFLIKKFDFGQEFEKISQQNIDFNYYLK